MFFGARIGRRRREYHHYTSAHDERRQRDLLFHARNPSQSAQLVEKKVQAFLNRENLKDKAGPLSLPRIMKKFCNKDGCTKESLEAFMKSAEGVLSKEQMATLKTEGSKMSEKKDGKA
jgi:hypothetical protein